MKYGDLPRQLGVYEVDCREMMFYQYLPIKFPKMVTPVNEDRLECFDKLIGTICCDFIGEYGLNAFVDSYIYLTAKSMFQKPLCSFNRPGYHSDGFLTPDVNYIWCDRSPTIFNKSTFDLTPDDKISQIEMESQALPENEVTYPVNTILRLNQFNIHKVADVKDFGMRTFLKISFSGDKYDLIGNSHNYSLDYLWKMKPRKVERNIPQSNLENI